MPRKSILTAGEGEPQEEESGYWTAAGFERRFVANTLMEMGLREDAKKLIGREPKTFADLWEAIKKDSSRPLSEQWGDLNELLSQKVNDASRFLGILKKKEKR